MAKIRTNDVVLENLADVETQEIPATAYGTIMEELYTEPKTNKKKDEVRDYKKTPEVLAILAQHSSKSEAIRALNNQGMKKGEIADTLRIRYQHVNNVLNQKLKKTS